MPTGTLAPSPRFTGFDSNGNPLSGGLLYTYVAGTSTLATTYTDVGLLVANANPIVLNSAGRPSSGGSEVGIYLVPGQSYKFVLQNSLGASVWTQDNVAAVPTSAANLDITGTAGEALTAGQAVYLSDGSGSKVSGQWYKADAANAYSSALPQIGMVPSSIASGSTGSIRLAGQVTGLTVSIGLSYYVGTAGAITSTAPVQARKLGAADSSTSIILTPNPSVPVQEWVNDFRLTLTTAVPVTTADVTAATTIFCSPLTGNRIALPDSSGNPVRVTSAEFSIAVPATTSQVYDIFVFNNSGVATLELLAWTNDTTRATAIIRTTTGRYYKTGDLTRLYLGSFRTTAVSGQTEDSFAKRYLWNYYNRVPRLLRVTETTDTWVYTTATIRQANAAAANQLDVVVGVAEIPIEVEVQGFALSSAAGAATDVAMVLIGEDSTTTMKVGTLTAPMSLNSGAVNTLSAKLKTYPAVGRHFYAWLEFSTAVGTTTWRGDNGVPTNQQAGIHGVIQG